MRSWKPMKTKMNLNSRRCLFRVMGAMAMLGTFVIASGCQMAPCNEVQRTYERAVRAESSFQPLSAEGSPHLAMAIRLDLLNDLTKGLLNAAIGEAISHRGTLTVSGQNVAYGVSSRGATLRFDASNQCATCLRIRGDIDAAVEATLPVVGRRSSPLSGGIDWTVPLAVNREADGKVAVFIDTRQAVRMAVPRVQNAALRSLPSQWRGVIESALVSELASVLAENMPAIRLFGYELPGLGLGGLEITPSLFSFDARSNALVLGVRTNLPVPESAFSQAELVEALRLGEGQNIALGVQPAAIAAAVRLGMQQNRIARRYTLIGEASRNGTSHAVVDRLKVGGHPRVSDALALGMDFRLFNFGSGLGCFSMRGDARSRIQIRNGRVELAVEGVNFSGSALADAVNWGSAQFIEQSQRMVSKTLNDDMVFSPEMGLSLRGDRVSTAAGMVVLRGAGQTR